MRNGVNFQCNCQGNNNSSLLLGRNNFNHLGYYQGQQQQGYYQQDQQTKQLYDRQIDCQAMIFKLRKRVHETVAENLLLKQQLSKLKNYTIQMQLSNQSLRGQLQNSLQELKNYDTQIQQYRKQSLTYNQQIQQYQMQIQSFQNSLTESKQFSEFLQQRIKSYQDKVKQSQLVIENNNRFMYNLNQQNQLLIKIKATLTQDNLRLKNSYQNIIENYQFKQSQINKLTYQIDYLLKQITQLQEIINNKRIFGISSGNLFNSNNLRNLQMMTKDRSLLLTNIDRNIQPNMDRKQSDMRNKDIIGMRNNQVEMERYLINEQVNRKLLKYKKKALKYKQQRDQLLLQIEQAKQQIGNITLTREFNID